MHLDLKTIVLLAGTTGAVFETLRRLNGGHVKGMASVPIRPVIAAKGPPHGIQP